MRKTWLIVLTIILSLNVSASQFKEILKRAENPSLIEISVKTPPEMDFSSLKIVATKKSKVFVMHDGKEPIGVVITNALYKYRLTDKFFLPVAKRNFKNAIKGKYKIKDNALVFSEKAKYTVIWSYKLGKKFFKYPKLESGPFPQKIKKVFKGLTYGHPSLTLLFQKLYPKERFVTIYLDSGKNKLIYVVNPVYLKTETLFTILKYPFKYKNLRGKYRTVPVAKKTLKSHWFEKEETPYTITKHTEFDLTNDKGEHILLTTKQKVLIAKDNAPAYVVNLISHIFRKRKISIYKVNYVKVNGKQADFAHLNHLLIVKLPKDLKAGQTVEIETQTSGDIALIMFGSQRWSLGLWAWYPKPKHSEESSTFLIKAKVHKPYLAFASGTPLKRYSDDKYNYLVTKLDFPGQYPVIAAGRYQTCSRELNGYKCTAACYFEKKEAIANKFMDFFFASINYYSSIFKVDYPFKNQFLVEGISKGQAPPGIVFFSRKRTEKKYEKVVLTDKTFHAFVHEIAHGYWGHIAKIPNQREMWISEALSQYSSWLCMSTINANKKEAEDFYKYTLNLWEKQTKLINKGGVLFFCTDFSNENVVDNIDSGRLLYAKGPIIFLALKQKLEHDFGKRKGTAIFTVFLRKLLREYRFKNLYTVDLINVLNSLTKEDWFPWFEKYVLTEAVPPVDIQN